MEVSVEISYYPLNVEFITPIEEFIERISKYENLIVRKNSMSTQVFGEYSLVMDILKKEIEKSFEVPSSVFVLKIVNANLS